MRIKKVFLYYISDHDFLGVYAPPLQWIPISCNQIIKHIYFSLYWYHNSLYSYHMPHIYPQKQWLITTMTEICWFFYLKSNDYLDFWGWKLGRAAASGGSTVRVYIEIHRSGKLSVNHKLNWQLYMLKHYLFYYWGLTGLTKSGIIMYN